ncbi:MAG: T9SS type A sorting domain-containing protein [Bacteroidota bacterium]
MQITTIRQLTALLTLALFVASAGAAGQKTFIGLGNPNTSWNKAANWSPAGEPTSDDTVYIPFGSPYVAVTGAHCQAHTIVIQDGGRLVLRKSDPGKKLYVAHDFIVEAGGTFNTDGSPGTNGPQVNIGGDVVNHGTWDLSGVSTGNPGVIFDGVGTQRISGTSNLTFQNIKNNPNDSLIVDGVHVGVMGVLNPSDGFNVTTVNDGGFNVGGPPLPITLAWFEASYEAESNAVQIAWQTLSEIDNYGFYVERRLAAAGEFEEVGFVPSQGNGILPQLYSFRDEGVASGDWYYRIRQMDLTGESTESEHVLVSVPVVTGVGESGAPAEFALHQNYPNPFNPSTELTFSVASEGRAMVRIYNTLGQEVATLFDGETQPGTIYHLRFEGESLTSGSYFYTLESAGVTAVRRMLLLK